MSTSKDLSSLVDSLQAKAAAKPAKAALYQAKLDAKIASIIAKGKTVVIDGATVTSYDLDSGSSGGGSSGGGSSTTGSTYVLTAGVDSRTGTAGDDTFDGSINANSAVTFSAADALSGGAGTDRLVIQNIGSVSTTSSTISSIENIEVYGMTDNATLNLTNTSGVQSILLSSSGADGADTGDTIGTYVVSGLSGVTSVAVTGNTTTNGADSYTFTSAATGSADSVILYVDGVGDTNTTLNTDNDDIIIDPTSGTNGYETINIVSRGSASFVTLNDGNSTTLGTVNVSGSAALTLEITPTTVTTVNASTATGAVSLTVGAANQSITGGSAADNINMAGNYTSADTINGGAGTDVLWLTAAESVVTSSQTSRVTNVEKIRLTNEHEGTLDLSYWGATGAVITAAGHAADAVISYSAGTGTLELGATDQEETSLVVNGNLASLDDILNVTVGSSTAAITDIGTITANNFETVNVIIQGGAVTAGDAIAVSPSAGAVINVSGAFGGVLGTLTAPTINASGVVLANVTDTGVTLTAGTAARVTGSNGIDVLNGSSGADILIGGSGADSLDGNDGNDVFSPGLGADTIDIDEGTTVASGTAATVIADVTGSYSTASAATTYLDTLVLQDAVAEGTYTVTLNTGVVATSVVVAAAVNIGTTTVTAKGFLLVSAGDAEATGDARLYQDTDGDGVIEAGEFSMVIDQVDPTAAEVAVSVTGGALLFTITDL